MARVAIATCSNTEIMSDLYVSEERQYVQTFDIKLKNGDYFRNINITCISPDFIIGEEFGVHVDEILPDVYATTPTYVEYPHIVIRRDDIVWIRRYSDHTIED